LGDRTKMMSLLDQTVLIEAVLKEKVEKAEKKFA
jgi:hypothetical protein